MHLRSASVLALLFLPTLGAGVLAQEPPVQEERLHVVRAGETLSQLARIYFDTASAWSRIFEANRDRIEDPDRILPGLELRIPGAGAALRQAEDPDPRVIDVTLMVADTPRVLTPVGGTAADRRDLLRMRPFRATSSPNPVEERSVFHGMHQPVARAPTRPGVMLAPPEEALAVPRSVFHGASWIEGQDDDPPVVGRVVGFEGAGAVRVARTTLQPHDLVEVELEEGHGIEEGDRLIGFMRGDRIWRVGRVMVPTGILLVQAVDGERAIARVEGGFARFELGHRVTPMRPFPLEPGRHPLAAEEEVPTAILAFAERREIYLPGDQAFIPLGVRDGISVGDRFLGVAGGRDGLEGRSVATFQVIRVGEGVSTVRITGVEAPTAVRRGLELRRIATMP